MKLSYPTDSSALPELTTKLLPKFIDSKLVAYVEPTKKGTPKGEPVGFSLTKYQATLYALRDRVLADKEDLFAQAKELGISYGLLRKWRSEKKFKDLVSQHEKEFITYLLGADRYSGYGRLDLLDKAEAIFLQALHSKQKESSRKLMILIHGKVQDEVKRSNTTAVDLRKHQMLVLDQAIEILQDRRAATKHRKDVINLLSGVRETLR
jgi:hypothetical protein